MPEVNSDRKLQRDMHKDFFDRCKNAIDNGCYFEAVLMEYASIEARLEVIMGVIGLPCNKQLSSSDRQSVKISNRIGCLKRVYRDSNMLSDAPIPNSFWKQLNDWIKTRNIYIHGLYKNELQYKDAKDQVMAVLERGYQNAGALEKNGDQETAYVLFMSLGEYKDSFVRANKPYYDLGVAKREAAEWDAAVTAFEHAGVYEDAAEQVKATRYAEGEAKRAAQDWNGARQAFEKADNYLDSVEQIKETTRQEAESYYAAADYQRAYDLYLQICLHWTLSK